MDSGIIITRLSINASKYSSAINKCFLLIISPIIANIEHISKIKM